MDDYGLSIDAVQFWTGYRGGGATCNIFFPEPVALHQVLTVQPNFN